MHTANTVVQALVVLIHGFLFVAEAASPSQQQQVCGHDEDTGELVRVEADVDCASLLKNFKHCGYSCKIGWSITWCVVAVIISLSLLFYLRKRLPKIGIAFDPAVLYFCAFGYLAEGIGYFVTSVVADSFYAGWNFGAYKLFKGMGLTLQILTGNFLWIQWAFLAWYHRPPSWWIFKYTGSAAIVAALLFVVSAALGTGMEPMVFILWFEPVLWLRLGASLVIAGSVPEARNWTLLFFACKFVTLLTHVYTIGIVMAPDLERGWSYPSTRIGHCVFDPISAIALVYMHRIGVFMNRPKLAYEHPHMPDEEVVALRTAELSAASGKSGVKWRSKLVSPEFLWMCAVPGLCLAFLFAGALLFGVTKPDMHKDAIYNMYNTVHTCILLDYLPGSYVAYVFFSWYVLAMQAAFITTFIRCALAGSLTHTLLTGITVTFAYFAYAQFPLALVLSPLATSVLAHSIPYMLAKVGETAFIVVGIFRVEQIAKMRPSISWRRRFYYIVFASFYAILIGYGMLFMFSTLMNNTGMGINNGKPDRSVVHATEAYADRDGSSTLMESMLPCSGEDDAQMNLPHPWGFIPSEMVGRNRTYTLVDDSSATSSFLQVDSFRVDGYGSVNISAKVLTDGGATNASTASLLPGPRQSECDVSGHHFFPYDFFAFCRHRSLETADWYVLQALGGEDLDSQCLGAGIVAEANLPAKFAGGTAVGSCVQLLLGKEGGGHEKELRQSASVPGALVTDHKIAHLRWSTCPNAAGVADFVAERTYSFEDGDLEFQLDLAPFFVTILSIGLLIAYPILHPLREVPLAMHVASYEKVLRPRAVEEHHIPEVKHQLPLQHGTRSTFHLCITPRRFLLAGLLLLDAAAFAVYWVNNAVHGPALEGVSVREHMRQQPGACISSVFYVFFAGCATLSILMEVYHQHYESSMRVMRIVCYVVSSTFFVGLLLGPLSLIQFIPEYSQYNWTGFNGFDIMMLTFVFWIMYQSALLAMCIRSVLPSPVPLSKRTVSWLVAEMVFGLASIVLLFSTMTRDDHHWPTFAALVASTLWAMADSRCLTFKIVNIRISDSADLHPELPASDAKVAVTLVEEKGIVEEKGMEYPLSVPPKNVGNTTLTDDAHSGIAAAEVIPLAERQQEDEQGHSPQQQQCGPFDNL